MELQTDRHKAQSHELIEDFTFDVHLEEEAVELPARLETRADWPDFDAVDAKRARETKTRRPPSHVGRWFALATVVAIGAGAAAVYFTPALRVRAEHRIGQVGRWVRAQSSRLRGTAAAPAVAVVAPAATASSGKPAVAHVTPAKPGAVALPRPQAVAASLVVTPSASVAPTTPAAASTAPSVSARAAETRASPSRRRRTGAERAAPSEDAAGTPHGEGVLFVQTLPWSQVFVDGRFVRNTPVMGLPLPAGAHRVTLISDELGVRVTEAIRIQPGETTRIIRALQQ